MTAQSEFVTYIMNLPEAERASLLSSMWPARVLADAMHLNGAGVMGGDVQHALARLGLRLVSVDDPDPERTRQAAEARFHAITEQADCACGALWMRLRDADGPGTGWWHHDDEEGITRKCPGGERPPRRR